MQYIAQLQANHIGLPNAISLNIDGKNEVFKALNITNQVLLEFSIYNRYGQRVFSRCSPAMAGMALLAEGLARLVLIIMSYAIAFRVVMRRMY